MKNDNNNKWNVGSMYRVHAKRTFYGTDAPLWKNTDPEDRSRFKGIDDGSICQLIEVQHSIVNNNPVIWFKVLCGFQLGWIGLELNRADLLLEEVLEFKDDNE